MFNLFICVNILVLFCVHSEQHLIDPKLENIDTNKSSTSTVTANETLTQKSNNGPLQNHDNKTFDELSEEINKNMVSATDESRSGNKEKSSELSKESTEENDNSSEVFRDKNLRSLKKYHNKLIHKTRPFLDQIPQATYSRPVENNGLQDQITMKQVNVQPLPRPQPIPVLKPPVRGVYNIPAQPVQPITLSPPSPSWMTVRLLPNVDYQIRTQARDQFDSDFKRIEDYNDDMSSNAYKYSKKESGQRQYQDERGVQPPNHSMGPYIMQKLAEASKPRNPAQHMDFYGNYFNPRYIDIRRMREPMYPRFYQYL